MCDELHLKQVKENERSYANKIKAMVFLACQKKREKEGEGGRRREKEVGPKRKAEGERRED